MSRLFSVGFRLQVIFYIWTCCFTCLTATSLTVEQRLQALEATNVEIKAVLADKTSRLEMLENEVKQLKSVVIELTRQKQTTKKDVGIAINNQPAGKNVMLRTCHELHLVDPSLTSGMHWIDPDGQGIGDDPIQVYCNMTTGTTSILHDSESSVNVGHCADPGCYSKTINYYSSMRQIITLADLSTKCQQTIRYDCNYAPFVSNGVTYSWWNDRDGNSCNFSPCQCGIDNNCVESYLSCNCDSNLPIPQYDIGTITNKATLPVTQLSFGRTLLETSSGVYTLGRLECSGQVAVNGMASSCADLWKIGHTLSGMYSVMGTQFVEALYCDFTKLSTEPGFQTRIGDVDVKSSPTYFYVQRDSSFETLNTPITYETTRLNIGGAMDGASGIFTAPKTGRYFLAFSGTVRRPSSYGGYVYVSLTLNGNLIGYTFSDGVGVEYESISFQSTLNLNTGDRVWLQIDYLSNNASLYSDSRKFIHFTGSLLQEDISLLYRSN